MIISAEACVSWLLRVSKALLAEATNRLRTSADIVATSATPSLTTSFESLLTCSWGNELWTYIASNALPKTSANTIQPIAIGLTNSASCAGVEAGGLLRSEFESGVEHRAFHMNIEAQIEAAAGLVVEVDAAIAQVKVDPGLHCVVDRALQAPVAMGGDAKPADIALGSQPKPAGKKPAREVDMISPGNQRIDPA